MSSPSADDWTPAASLLPPFAHHRSECGAIPVIVSSRWVERRLRVTDRTATPRAALRPQELDGSEAAPTGPGPAGKWVGRSECSYS